MAVSLSEVALIGVLCGIGLLLSIIIGAVCAQIGDRRSNSGKSFAGFVFAAVSCGVIASGCFIALVSIISSRLDALFNVTGTS